MWDGTNYVHIHDPVNDAVEDSMNASLKKKVTFADTSPLDLPPSSSLMESAITTDPILNDDVLTPEEPSNSLSTSDLSQSVARKSILQKPSLVNGSTGEEKIYHGLAIRPHDEMIFERSDSSLQGTTDCIQTLTLTNMGDKILTFKIKTTSPDKFRVKPGCSLLHPGASTTVSVYLLKAYCTPTSNIHKEKFLIIWTLIGQELKQAQLVEFWKNVPISVLYEHRLKCTFSHKSSPVIPINPSIEPPVLRPIVSFDSSVVEMQKLLKDSLVLQKSTIAQTSHELRRIRFLLLIIFALLILILLWDVFKYFFSSSSSSSSSSVKTDL
jgi:hypothetical protein